jgi:hypothetical protein
MHHRLVRHPSTERIVLDAIRGCGPGALLGLVGAPPSLRPSPAGRSGRDLDCVSRDSSLPGALGQRLELIGGLVYCLEMALVLVLASGWGDVRVPALGHAASSELDISLIKGGLQLEEK